MSPTMFGCVDSSVQNSVANTLNGKFLQSVAFNIGLLVILLIFKNRQQLK